MIYGCQWPFVDEFHCEFSVSFDFIDNNFEDITSAECIDKLMQCSNIITFIFCCQVFKLTKYSSSTI